MTPTIKPLLIFTLVSSSIKLSKNPITRILTGKGSNSLWQWKNPGEKMKIFYSALDNFSFLIVDEFLNAILILNSNLFLDYYVPFLLIKRVQKSIKGRFWEIYMGEGVIKPQPPVYCHFWAKFEGYKDWHLAHWYKPILIIIYMTTNVIYPIISPISRDTKTRQD